MGFVSVVFASLIPITYILRGVRAQRFSDHHVPVRQQRPVPLLVGIVSVLMGAALLNWFGAPRTLVALIEAMLVGLLVSLAVTLFWKISIHVSVVAGSRKRAALYAGDAVAGNSSTTASQTNC